jgi:hypothetical protein
MTSKRTDLRPFSAQSLTQKGPYVAGGTGDSNHTSKLTGGVKLNRD